MSQPVEAKQGRRWLGLLVAVVVIVIAVIAAWLLWPRGDEATSPGAETASETATAAPATSPAAKPTATPENSAEASQPAEAASPTPTPASRAVKMKLGDEKLAIGEVEVDMPTGVRLTSLTTDSRGRTWLVMADETTSLEFTFVVAADPVADISATCDSYNAQAAKQLAGGKVTTAAEELADDPMAIVRCSGESDEWAFTWHVFGNPNTEAFVYESRVSKAELAESEDNLQRIRNYVACEIARDLGTRLPVCGP